MEPRKLSHGSGKWQARYSLDGQVYGAGTYDTKREAQLAGYAALLDASKPKAIKKEKSKVTLAEFAPKALSVLATQLAPGTMENHERNLRLHLLPVFGEMRLRDIKPDDVDDWWASVPESGARRASYFTLSRVMRLAKKYGHVKWNPCQTEGASKTVARERPELSEDDAWRIIEALDADTKAFVVVMFGGSLRIGEALGLDRKHVDLKTGVVTVEQQLVHEGEGERIVHRTKTKKSRTTVLPDWAMDELKGYLSRRPAGFGFMPLFTRPDGKRLGRSQVARALHMARSDTSLDWAHAHDFRHTSLTVKMLKSGDLFGVMASAGHEDIRSAKRYQHVGDERLANVANSWTRAAGLG